jgi:hypothetical protein
VVRVFAMPKLNWAAPLVDIPDAKLSRATFWAIVGRNSWWCAGRWFACNVEAWPAAGYVMQGIQAAARWQYLAPSTLLDSRVRHCVEWLGLQVAECRGHEPIKIKAAVGGDPRVTAEAVRLGLGQTCDTSMRTTQHIIRVAARIKALQMVNSSRWDAEGSQQIDVALSSAPAWKRYVRGLPKEEFTKLMIYRCGAMATQTRLTPYMGSRPRTLPLV